VDWDEMIDEYADMLGVSPKIIMATQKVMQIRNQRNQQMQQQQMLQNSMAAAQGAETLSNTDVGCGQNALQRMIGGA